MLSHAVFTLESLRCTLLILRFCLSLWRHIRDGPREHSAHPEAVMSPVARSPWGTGPPSAPAAPAPAWVLSQSSVSRGSWRCACTSHLALRWWSGPHRTGFCVCPSCDHKLPP